MRILNSTRAETVWHVDLWYEPEPSVCLHVHSGTPRCLLLLCTYFTAADYATHNFELTFTIHSFFFIAAAAGPTTTAQFPSHLTSRHLRPPSRNQVRVPFLSFSLIYMLLQYYLPSMMEWTFHLTSHH